MSTREEIADLRAQIRELRAYVQQLQQDTPDANVQRVRLVRNEGEEAGGFQPFVFQTANADDRGGQFESAQMLGPQQFLAFYQDGRWHGCRCGTPPDPPEVAGCEYCIDQESPNPIEITLDFVNNITGGGLDYGVDWAGMVTKTHSFVSSGLCNYGAPEIESVTTLTVGTVSAGNAARARLTFAWGPADTFDLIGRVLIYFEVQDDFGNWRGANGAGFGSHEVYTDAIATPPALIDCFAEHAITNEIDQFDLVDFVSGQIEASPSPPPPPPPIEYAFDTWDDLQAAVVGSSSYLPTDRLRVEGDPLPNHNGIYVPLMATGETGVDDWINIGNAGGLGNTMKIGSTFIIGGGIGNMTIGTTFQIG